MNKNEQFPTTKRQTPKNRDGVLRRLITILQKLSEQALPTKKELQEEFNVTAKTIERDIYQRLNYFPIEKNGLGQFQFIEGFSLNKAKLKEDEMLFIYLSLSQIKDINKNFDKTTHSIFSKLLTPGYASAYHIKEHAMESIDMDSMTLNALEDAISLKNRVHLVLNHRAFYIEPYKVVSFDGIWYLLGKDIEDGKIKTVFIHEIEKMQIQKEKYDLDKPIDEILSNVHSAWFEDGNSMDVTIKVHQNAAFNFKLKNLLPSQEIKQEFEDGSLLIDFKVSTQEDIDNIIKAWIPDVEIIAPQSYRESFVKEMKSYLKLYD